MKTLPALLIASCLSAASQAATVNVGNSIIPTGLGAGDSFQLVFVTNGTTARGTLGDGSDATITFWNTYVNTQAGNSNHTNTDFKTIIRSISWYAIASTTTVNAKDNATVAAPVYNLGLSLVAADATDMWNGNIGSPILTTQHGTNLSGTNENSVGVWTGSTSAGIKQTGTYRALDENSTETMKGSAIASNGTWITLTTWRGDPTETAHVYALSEVINITAVPEPSAALLGAIGLLFLLRRRR